MKHFYTVTLKSSDGKCHDIVVVSESVDEIRSYFLKDFDEVIILCSSLREVEHHLNFGSIIEI